MYPAMAVWDGGSRGMQLKKAACAGPRHSCSCRLLARCPGGLDPCQPRLGGTHGWGTGGGYCSFSAGPETAPASAQKCLTFRVYVPWTSCAGGRRSLRNPCGRQMEHSSPPARPTSALRRARTVPALWGAFPTNGSVFPGIGRDRAGLSASSPAFGTLRAPSRACVHNF